MNFYDRNEWVHLSDTFLRGSHPRYRLFHVIIQEVWDRYKRLMFVAETGAEDDERADWFNYICDEVVVSHNAGVPVEGICIYPILHHPGWVDDRHCCNGLFDYAGRNCHREPHQPLAEAVLKRHSRHLEAINTAMKYNDIDLICLSHLRWGFVFQRQPTAPNESICT